ncbi:MAG: HEPN domain-containing protein [Ruminococcus sp.]|jgi:HEPN domain-containing protein|nr:HEPN domain-containing protein [Ruminococcus sp.]
MRDKNRDSHRCEDWFSYAEFDLASAKTLYNSKNALHSAFHCQQCIEKALKGYLLLKRGKLYDGHNITWLVKQASMLSKAFDSYIAETVTINKFYIETRYPPDTPLVIDEKYLKKLIKISEEILDFALIDYKLW